MFTSQKTVGADADIAGMGATSEGSKAPPSNSRLDRRPGRRLEATSLVQNGSPPLPASPSRRAMPLARVQADLRQFLAGLQSRGVLGGSGRLLGWKPRWPGARIAAAALGVFFKLSLSTRARAATALTLARLSFGLFGWTATVSSWKRRLPAAEAPPVGADALASSIDEAVRSAAAWHVMGVDCKERALSCWAMARAAGLPATVVVGVELYPLSGHCWCEIGSSIVGDDPQRCRRYAPVFRYE